MDVSPVIGSGFPVDRAPPEQYPTLVVFATGTGIAPIKALIESSSLDVSPLAAPCCILLVLCLALGFCRGWGCRQHTIHMDLVHMGLNRL